MTAPLTPRATEQRQKGARTITEYRVLSKRVGTAEKDVRYRSRAAVLDRIGRLTSDEPWRHYGDEETRRKGPDDLACCRGTVYDECACGGFTMREKAMDERKDLPAIEYVRVDARRVTTTPWEPVEAPQKPA